MNPFQKQHAPQWMLERERETDKRLRWIAALQTAGQHELANELLSEMQEYRLFADMKRAA